MRNIHGPQLWQPPPGSPKHCNCAANPASKVPGLSSDLGGPQLWQTPPGGPKHCTCVANAASQGPGLSSELGGPQLWQAATSQDGCLESFFPNTRFLNSCYAYPRFMLPSNMEILAQIWLTPFSNGVNAAANFVPAWPYKVVIMSDGKKKFGVIPRATHTNMNRFARAKLEPYLAHINELLLGLRAEQTFGELFETNPLLIRHDAPKKVQYLVFEKGFNLEPK